MTRIVLTLVVLAVLAVFAGWLAARPGEVSLVWGGYRIETSATVLALLFVAFGLMVYAVAGVGRFLVSMPKRIGTSVQSRRRVRGYRALTRGMVAIAAGDPGEAERQAHKAKALLHEPPLTMLLSAQAAQLSGDDKAAEAFFLTMLDNAEMEFLGLRGLLIQSVKRKDWPLALSYAERAQRLQPKSGWLNQSLFDLQARTGNWADAERTVRDGVSHHLLSGAESRRRRAVVIYRQALELSAAGNREEALRLAQKAADLDAGFVPAAELAGRALVDLGKHRRARQTIERAWQQSPHPALAELYLEAEPGARDEPLKGVQALQRLVATRPEHPESAFALASAFTRAQLWGEARARTEPLLAGQPSARVYRLMADIETGDGSDPAAAGRWLERASRADHDPAWVCGQCGFTLAAWSAFCPRCDSFDTVAWGEGRPSPAEAALPAAPPMPALAASLATSAQALPVRAGD
ncbi:MAG: heme biosynthesis protein HemY [Proteobacteria bacterium]|nr:heme biosynthesis protein HemY [Pseudomonadota bacterium]